MNPNYPKKTYDPNDPSGSRRPSRGRPARGNPPPTPSPSKGRSDLNSPTKALSRIRGYDARGQELPALIHGQPVGAGNLQQFASMFAQAQMSGQMFPMAGPMAGPSVVPLVSAETGARSRVREQGIPDTPLVRQYRDPRTGEINLTALRKDIPRDTFTGAPIQLGSSALSQRSRARLIQQTESQRGVKERHLNLLERLPESQFKKVSSSLGDRYERRPSQALALIQSQQHRTVRRLQPSTDRSDDRANPWVHRSLRSMEAGFPPETIMRNQYDSVKPVGALGFGPQRPSSELTPLHTQELEQFQQQIGGRFTQKQFDFLRRVQRLYNEDEHLVDLYTKYRALADRSDVYNRDIAGRMVARPNAHFDHIERDRRSVRDIRSTIAAPRGLGSREERVQTRHDKMKGKAIIMSTHIPRDLRSLPEFNEECDESEYESAEED